MLVHARDALAERPCRTMARTQKLDCGRERPGAERFNRSGGGGAALLYQQPGWNRRGDVRPGDSQSLENRKQSALDAGRDNERGPVPPAREKRGGKLLASETHGAEQTETISDRQEKRQSLQSRHQSKTESLRLEP